MGILKMKKNKQIVKKRLLGLIGYISLIGLISLIAMFAHLQLAHAAIISKPPNNLGLLANWGFNEGVGQFAGDNSGSGNTGTLNNFALSGATSNWTNGKHGKALNFDGSDDYNC